MSKKIIYVVSGMLRSGTSMMMRALTFGGMDPAYDKREGRTMEIINGYVPNRDGYYELSYANRQQKGFPAMYEGKLVKLLLHRTYEIRNMPPNVIFKTVMMRRDRTEILKSINRVRTYMGTELNDDKVMRSIIKGEGNIPFFKLHSRTFDEIWYPDVINDPLAIFTQLKASGWPIDVEKAVTVPDPTQYRFKKT